MADSTHDRVLRVLKTVTTNPCPPMPTNRCLKADCSIPSRCPDLVSALEQEFSIKIPDADLNPRKFDSIARIESYIAARA